LNDRLSTPNKLFECLAAGVPVVSSDFPERRRVLLEDPSGPLGVLCDPADPADIASAIREILDLPRDRYMAMRQRCEHAAQERWNWEADAARLIALYGKLMTHAPSRAARSMKGAGWRSW
jgi:glycosyltransferase involved in cell wall biosynthesis